MLSHNFPHPYTRQVAQPNLASKSRHMLGQDYSASVSTSIRFGAETEIQSYLPMPTKTFKIKTKSPGIGGLYLGRVCLSRLTSSSSEVKLSLQSQLAHRHNILMSSARSEF